jgi:hypothetical protein
LVRKSIAFKRGRYFAAAGLGKYGPYVVGTVRYKRAVAKVTAGTRGSTVCGNVRIYKKVRAGGDYNFTHHSRAVEIRVGRKKLRVQA